MYIRCRTIWIVLFWSYCFRNDFRLFCLVAFVMVIDDSYWSPFEFTDPNSAIAWTFNANPVWVICTTDRFFIIMAFVLNHLFPLLWCALNHKIDFFYLENKMKNWKLVLFIQKTASLLHLSCRKILNEKKIKREIQIAVMKLYSFKIRIIRRR